MKLLSISKWIFLLLAITLIYSCHKEQPNAPQVVNKRLFYCKVNGKDWKPHVDWCFLCTPENDLYAYTNGQRSFSIEAQIDHKTSSVEIRQAIWIDLFNIDQNNVPEKWGIRYYNFKNGNCAHFFADTTYDNYINITRYDGGIGSQLVGEFSGRLLSQDNNCTDTIMITEGKFDFQTDF